MSIDIHTMYVSSTCCMSIDILYVRRDIHGSRHICINVCRMSIDVVCMSRYFMSIEIYMAINIHALMYVD